MSRVYSGHVIGVVGRGRAAIISDNTAKVHWHSAELSVKESSIYTDVQANSRSIIIKPVAIICPLAVRLLQHSYLQLGLLRS